MFLGTGVAEIDPSDLIMGDLCTAWRDLCRQLEAHSSHWQQLYFSYVSHAWPWKCRLDDYLLHRLSKHCSLGRSHVLESGAAEKWAAVDLRPAGLKDRSRSQASPSLLLSSVFLLEAVDAIKFIGG